MILRVNSPLLYIRQSKKVVVDNEGRVVNWWSAVFLDCKANKLRKRSFAPIVTWLLSWTLGVRKVCLSVTLSKDPLRRSAQEEQCYAQGKISKTVSRSLSQRLFKQIPKMVAQQRTVCCQKLPNPKLLDIE